MNLPNKLTLVRCALTPVFLLVLLWQFPFHYGLALALFAIASLTDMLDGKIARKQKLVTNLGKFLDPLADKALTTAAYLGLMVIFGGDALCWATMIILAREFMVTSVRLLAAKDGVVVAASMWGKAKTVTQMGAVLYMLAALQVMELLPAAVAVSLDDWVFGVGHLLIWVSVLLTVVSGIQYVWALRHYFKEN